MKGATLARVTAGTDPGPADELPRRLDALERRLRALEDAEAARRRRRLRPGDVPLLMKLLPAAAGRFGSEPFTSGDLVDVTSPAFHALLCGRNVISLGKLLARAEGVAVPPHVIEAAGPDHRPRLWRVLQIIEPGE